jgi:hypothetical protein
MSNNNIFMLLIALPGNHRFVETIFIHSKILLVMKKLLVLSMMLFFISLHMNAKAWPALGTGGMNPSVRTLTVYNNERCAGGGFTMAGGLSVSPDAKWNTAESGMVTKSIVRFSKDPQVPNTVLIAFDSLVRERIIYYAGAELRYRELRLTWEHVRGEWVGSGDIFVFGFPVLIHFEFASFKHNGTLTGFSDYLE